MARRARERDARSGKRGGGRRLAAIDMGSNAIRFLAAAVDGKGRLAPLAEERVAVRLGHDVFLSGRLTAPAMDAAVAALVSFRTRMEELAVTSYRAIATSAVRESANGAEFVSRVQEETGIALEVITGSEEARLVHLAVRHRLPLGTSQWILADLGGGSVEVSLVDGDGILWSESHTMGSVRLLEELSGSAESPGQFRRLLEEYAATLRVPSVARYRPPAGFIATGGNIETLAALAGERSHLAGVDSIPLPRLRAIIETLSRLSYWQRVEELGLKEDRADVILPAAMVYERLAVLSGVDAILVPHVGIKDGILLDLADTLAGRRERPRRLEEEAVAGALTLGRRYAFDEAHALHVARLAGSLFDQLRPLHGLGEDDRRLLVAAALLHDIGAYISYKRHHKHSHYLISESELPSFTPAQIAVVANVARYHRKSEPSPDHEAYAALPAADRARVDRLAALLRLADALDREHQQRVADVHAEVSNGAVRLRLVGAGDLLLEQWSLRRKSGMFERVYGVALRTESEGRAG